MRNTTIADLIQDIKDMDSKLGMEPRPGLSKLRKADLLAELEDAERYLEQQRRRLAHVFNPFRRPGPATGRIVERKATGPTITVVVQVGGKLVFAEVIGTVTRPSAVSKNLVMVRHLTDLGYPRVTLHSPKEIAA